MSQLLIKGGYGEHGRNCFVLQGPTHSLMFDCGVAGSGHSPLPDAPPALLSSISHLFLSHAHDDHVGAFSTFVQNGFSGSLVASEATLKVAGLAYDKCIVAKAGQTLDLGQDLRATFGRSGHCPGSLWFLVDFCGKRNFYSGDYQARSLCYRCDEVEGMHADLAIVDYGDSDSLLSAAQKQRSFIQTVDVALSCGKLVFLPAKPYGRGLELLFQLRAALPHAKLLLDDAFLSQARALLPFRAEFNESAFTLLHDFLSSYSPPDAFDVCLTADGQLKTRAVHALLANPSRPPFVLSTGRAKPGSPLELMLQEGRATHCPYSHHQSRADLAQMLEKNHFSCTLPFHSEARELIFKP